MHGVIDSNQICTENENKIHVKMFRKSVIKGVTKGEVKGKGTGDAMKAHVTEHIRDGQFMYFMPSI